MLIAPDASSAPVTSVRMSSRYFRKRRPRRLRGTIDEASAAGTSLTLKPGRRSSGLTFCRRPGALPPSRASCPDHRVGAHEERLGNGDAERLGGLEIDHEFHGGRQLDRKVPGPGALVNAIDVDSKSAVAVLEHRTIDHQVARARERRPAVDGGDALLERECCDVVRRSLA